MLHTLIPIEFSSRSGLRAHQDAGETSAARLLAQRVPAELDKAVGWQLVEIMTPKAIDVGCLL